MENGLRSLRLRTHDPSCSSVPGVPPVRNDNFGTMGVSSCACTTGIARTPGWTDELPMKSTSGSRLLVAHRGSSRGHVGRRIRSVPNRRWQFAAGAVLDSSLVSVTGPGASISRSSNCTKLPAQSGVAALIPSGFQMWWGLSDRAESTSLASSTSVAGRDSVTLPFVLN